MLDFIHYYILIYSIFRQSVGIVILGWVGVIPNTANHSKTTIAFFLNVCHHYPLLFGINFFIGFANLLWNVCGRYRASLCFPISTKTWKWEGGEGERREEGRDIIFFFFFFDSRTYQQYQTATSRDKSLIASVLGTSSTKKSKEHVSDAPSALGVLGQVSNQGDVVRDAVASVVGGNDASFVEYHKFEYVRGLGKERRREGQRA
jgi:hypothetical protein